MPRKKPTSRRKPKREELILKIHVSPHYKLPGYMLACGAWSPVASACAVGKTAPLAVRALFQMLGRNWGE